MHVRGTRQVLVDIPHARNVKPCGLQQRLGSRGSARGIGCQRQTQVQGQLRHCQRACRHASERLVRAFHDELVVKRTDQAFGGMTTRTLTVAELALHLGLALAPDAARTASGTEALL